MSLKFSSKKKQISPSAQLGREIRIFIYLLATYICIEGTLKSHRIDKLNQFKSQSTKLMKRLPSFLCYIYRRIYITTKSPSSFIQKKVEINYWAHQTIIVRRFFLYLSNEFYYRKIMLLRIRDKVCHNYVIIHVILIDKYPKKL